MIICIITEDSLKQIISREREGAAAAIGYRALWSSLKMAYRVNIKRNVVINCSENWTQMEANTEKHII